MKLTILGTGSTVPIKERWHVALALQYKGEIILFDCGEATQIRMQQAHINPMKIEKIFISHFHGDHFFGLPGIIYSMAMDRRTKPLTIYGPKGAKRLMSKLLDLQQGEVPYPIKVVEVEAPKVKTIFEGEDYLVQAVNTCHSVPNLSYAFVEKPRKNISKEKMKRFGIPPGKLLKELKEGKTIEVDGRTIAPDEVLEQRKGKKFAFSGDTGPCEEMVKLAKGADLLVHEATYAQEHSHKANDYQHSTASDAAGIAKKAEVKTLYLIHFSRRYKSVEAMLGEARKIFPNTFVAKDLMEVEF